MRFTGKSVLLTGAGSGIGRATARLFTREGAPVSAVDLSDGVEETAARHETITTMRGDPGSEQDVAAMVAGEITRHGGIDIVWANAGIGRGRPRRSGRPGLFGIESGRQPSPDVGPPIDRHRHQCGMPGPDRNGHDPGTYDAALARSRQDATGQLKPPRRGGDSKDRRRYRSVASNEASYINGQALVVYGGLSSSLPFAKPLVLGETIF